MFFPQQEYNQPFTPKRDEGSNNKQSNAAALEYTPVRMHGVTQIGQDLASN